MSLLVYTDKLDIPNNVALVQDNDGYFDGQTVLTGTDFCKSVLDTIDHAIYNSENTFISRTKDFGSLNRQNLSTGTKTLLNIESHPNVCFSVCECGNNALLMLGGLHAGMVLWETPFVACPLDLACDIVLKDGKHFKNFIDLMGVLSNEDK